MCTKTCMSEFITTAYERDELTAQKARYWSMSWREE
jgi:hypothetical protein